eukprot:1031392-Amphidinium_carterae.1
MIHDINCTALDIILCKYSNAAESPNQDLMLMLCASHQHCHAPRPAEQTLMLRIDFKRCNLKHISSTCSHSFKKLNFDLPLKQKLSHNHAGSLRSIPLPAASC